MVLLQQALVHHDGVSNDIYRPGITGGMAEEIGQSALERIRNDRGLTQAELGEKVGLSQAQIQRYETGIRRIPAHRAKKLGAALECHWLDLMDEASLAHMDATQILTPRETALVELYRGMSEDGRKAVFQIVDAMAEQANSVKRKKT